MEGEHVYALSFDDISENINHVEEALQIYDVNSFLQRFIYHKIKYPQ